MYTKHVLYDKLYLQLILLLNNVLPSITFSFPSLLIFTVCVCICSLSVCLSVCVQECSYACGDWSSMSGIFIIAPHLTFWNKASHWTLDKDPPFSTLLRLRLQTCAAWAGDKILVLPVWLASNLQTKQIPQSLIYAFFWYFNPVSCLKHSNSLSCWGHLQVYSVHCHYMPSF